MSEYLMVAHEIEKARLLALRASKENQRREETSSLGILPESRRSTRDGADSHPIGDGEIVAQTIHHTMKD